MKKILSVLTTLLLLASCSQEELGTPFYAGQEVSISAALSSSKNNDGKKRISGKDNVDRIDLTWDEGDEILVTVGDQSAVFTLSSGAGTNNAIFSGTMPADGASYSVQYPTFVPDLTEQRYVENGFGKDLMLMTTKEERTIDGGFALSADYALLGLQLTGDQQIGKIVVTNIAENKTYTLHSINVMLSAEPTLFYIVVPEGEWLQGFNVDIFANDNKTINKTLTKSGSITFSTEVATIMPTQWTTPDALDLGLSVKWATRNIGANKPEERGDFFAWGEVEPKYSYTDDNYKWCNGNTLIGLTKYCTDASYGYEGLTDGLTKLEIEDDAAYVNWGEQWRMPSNEEYEELRRGCNWSLIQRQGVTGYEGKSKINGNTIFFPTAGFQSGANVVLEYLGGYWSSSLNIEKQSCAYGLYLNTNDNAVGKYSNSNRKNGFLVRPILDNKLVKD
jgi:hypothetical protein